MEEEEVSILIGGRAGDGISSSGQVIAQLVGRLGYRVHMYFDYPSLVKGGHNFAIIRGARRQPGAVRERIDFLLALNQETIARHVDRLAGGGIIISDSGRVKEPGAVGLHLDEIVSEEGGTPIMRNTALIGAFARAAGIPWQEASAVLSQALPKETEMNLRIARRGFDVPGPLAPVPRLDQEPFPVFTGNEAMGIGLVEGGLQAYFGYPMSPTSNLLHFLVRSADKFGIQVIQPEGEIAVIQMALGGSYAGSRTAVGTSGGGFCLMTESLSLSGIAELPLVLVLGQRPGPATGLATYTAQSDLPFVLRAGHGYFPRLIAAPANLEEARFWSHACLDLAWKYQVPAIVLADKTLCESAYSLDPGFPAPPPVEPVLADPASRPYLRYDRTENGISPLRFPPATGEVIRVNSHVHDPDGITTEEPGTTIALAEKRARKTRALQEDLSATNQVVVGGDRDASTTILCWGSNGCACDEVGEQLHLRVIRPVVLSPFPADAFSRAMAGTERLIAAETNETGDLAALVRQMGYRVDHLVLKYDGRPFFIGELSRRIAEVS